MSSADLKAKRPLSPHIQIYHWHLTMVMSIVHRITGGALYFGTLLLAWWLVALAAGPGPFAFANWVLGSWLGLLVLFGYSWALIHHMLGGLRHFIWDFGYGLGKPARDQLALANLIGSIVLTVLLWVVTYWLRS
jgi:succinate dehydrogenase / fumarate reductase cytochrome b subunit